ncbi:uncharacterized protein ACBR49_004791 isoform 2-T2 [Aulostomus maculatus]
METEAPIIPTPDNKPNNGPQMNQKKAKNAKRKQLQHSADIVFTKGTSIQTMPSLSKQLKLITDCVIGLQYVWEYRSPSKSVPPHYQCKLCAVSRLQHDMLAHVKGWKHSFKYLQKLHPDKVTCTEEEAIKDPAVRKMIKTVAAEVEKTEGRGQLKVILKEPCEVPAFRGFRSATPKIMPPPAPPMGPNGMPFGPRFPDQRFPGEFPPHEGPYSDYPLGDRGGPGFGGFPSRQLPLMPDNGRDGFNSGRMYPDEYRGNQMGSGLLDRPVKKPLERPSLMGAAPDTGNDPNALLNYLDTFRIENENDAQLVLKVTQKLTDLLMEYRLRSVSTGSSLNSFSLSSTSFSSSSSRLPSSTGDQYFSGQSGPSRYSSGPPRYYK